MATQTLNIKRADIKAGDRIITAHGGDPFVEVEREVPDFPNGTVVNYFVVSVDYVRVGPDLWYYHDTDDDIARKANLTDANVRQSITKGHARIIQL